MRAMLASVFLLLAMVGATHADPLPPADRAAIEGVITRQLDAFQRDDAATAFSFAAPGIQAMFGDPDRFLDMVRRGYPPVYRPRSITMGPLEEQGGQVVQRVELIGPDGGTELALYFMEREPDGTWRIAGCQLTRSNMVGT